MSRVIRRGQDEVQAGTLHRKAFSSVIKAIDEETRRIDFIISTESVDRYGDIIRVKGWDLKAYKQNPVVLFGHMNREPPVGKSIRTWKEDGALRATAEFMPKEISPFADSIFQMYKGKFLRAVSVGFIPLDWKYVEDEEGQITGYDFVKQDLLEFSAVPVPANPDALMNARAKGIDTAPFKHWAEKMLDEWQDSGQEVRDLYGIDKKTVEAIRRKAAGTGMVLRLSPEEQRKLAQRNMGVEINITAKDLTGSGEEAQEKDQDTMKIKQGIVIDKSPKSAMFNPAVISKHADMSFAEKDGNVLLTIKGSNYSASYKLAGAVDDQSDIYGELIAAKDGVPDSRVAKDADDTKKDDKKDTGASAEKEGDKDTKKESKDPPADDKKDTKADDKAKDPPKDDAKGEKEAAKDDKSKDGDKAKDIIVIDLGTEAGSFEAKLIAFEEALDKSKDLGQSLSKTVSRKLEFLAGYMRELAERLAPGKSVDSKSSTSEKGAGGDDDIDMDDLGDALVKSVEPKLASIVERELNKFRGRLD
jgi:HK97 family phage prohead protease